MRDKLEEDLSYLRLLIDKGAYDKDINEPTPLEDKCRLVREVKEKFLADLYALDISFITSNLAWGVTEDVIGADEALSKGFLYSVLNYVELLEQYYKDIHNELLDKVKM